MKNNKNTQKNINRNKKVIISFSEEMLTGNSGNVLIGRFIEGLGLKELLDKELNIIRGKNITYPSSDLILMFLNSVIMGARRFTNIDMLKNDGVLRKINGYINFPVLSTITRFFYKTGYRNIIELSNIDKQLREKVWNKKPIKEVTLDLDSSVKGVFGNPEGAMKGYNPDKHGQKSYHPQLCYISETRECLHSWLRSGNCHTGNGSADFIKEALVKLPDSVDKITVRADSGYFDDKLITELENRNIEYITKVKLKNSKDRLYVQNWKDVSFKNKDEKISELYVTTFRYKCTDWKKERLFVGIKLLKKNALKDNKIKSDDLLFDLVKEKKYEYIFFVTNISKDELSIWDFYKARGECENLIENTKNQMYAGDFLVNNFYSNDFLFELCVLAYNLIVWIMYLSFKFGWKIEPNTFRLMLIRVAGRLLNKRGKLYLRLQKDYYWKDIWIKIEIMINNL